MAGRPRRVPANALQILPLSTSQVSAAELRDLETNPTLNALLIRSRQLATSVNRINRESTGAAHPQRQLLYLESQIRQQDALLKVAARRAHDLGPRALLAEVMLLLQFMLDRCKLAAAYLRISGSVSRVVIVRRRRLLDHSTTNRWRDKLIKTVVNSTDDIVAILDTLDRSDAAKDLRAIAEMRRYRALAAYYRMQCDLEIHDELRRTTLAKNKVDLGQLMSASSFAELESALRCSMWLLAARINSALDDNAVAQSCVLKAIDLADDENSDFLSLMLVDAIRLSQSDVDRARLIGRLSVASPPPASSPPLSASRIQRLSILRDALPFLIVRAAIDESDGRRSLLAATFDCYYRWQFGVPQPEGVVPTIRIVMTWAGEGCIVSGQGDSLSSVPLSIAPQLSEELTKSVETGVGNQRLIERVVKTIEDQVAHGVAGDLKGELRIETIGPVGLLPLFAMRIGADTVGAGTSAAYLHPRYGASGKESKRGSPDLLVVDQAFEGRAQEVTKAYVKGSPQTGERRDLLEFDSRSENGGEIATKIDQALSQTSRVLVFVHGYNDQTVATNCGLRLSRRSGMSASHVATLDLTHIEYAVVVACASGRPNRYVGPTSVAHALALAGVREILSTLWPVSSRVGADLAVRLVNGMDTGSSLADVVANFYKNDRFRAAPFTLIRE